MEVDTFPVLYYNLEISERAPAPTRGGFAVPKTRKEALMPKHPGGRPLKYRTAAALQQGVEEYFRSCQGEVLRDDCGEPVLDKYGQPVIVGAKPPTVTGLALALGFASRQALLNYQGRPQFNDAITRAKSRVEEYTEGRLFDRDGARGAQFSLKNNFPGWKDSAEGRSDGDPWGGADH